MNNEKCCTSDLKSRVAGHDGANLSNDLGIFTVKPSPNSMRTKRVPESSGSDQNPHTEASSLGRHLFGASAETMTVQP